MTRCQRVLLHSVTGHHGEMLQVADFSTSTAGPCGQG